MERKCYVDIPHIFLSIKEKFTNNYYYYVILYTYILCYKKKISAAVILKLINYLYVIKLIVIDMNSFEKK